jgi:prepilin-type processing-associated H-X9-DG protein
MVIRQAVWLACLAVVVSGGLAVQALGANAAPEMGVQKQSAENLQKVLLAGTAYANDHFDKWPAKLDELVGGDLLKDKSVLVDPADPKKRAWVYHPWTPEQQNKLDITTTPVVWSPIDDPKADRHVGFLDGHVEVVHGKADLDKLVEKAEAAAKK